MLRFIKRIKKMLSFFCLEQRKHISKICHMFGVGFSLPILKQFVLNENQNVYEIGFLIYLVTFVIIFEGIAVFILFKEEEEGD